MPPTVTYWTGIWDPHREAISGQVDMLRRLRGSDASVVSFSNGQRSTVSRHRGVIRLSARRKLMLRLLGALLERSGDVSHVVGPFNSWDLLGAVGRRPVLFTVVARGPRLTPVHYEKVAIFAVESEALRRDARAAGIEESRIRLIYPGVDLQRFTSTVPPAGRFQVLFASTPADAAEFEWRGIPALVSAAHECTDVDFVLRWRQWGDLAAAQRALQALNPPRNLVIEMGDVADMSVVYRHAHATICLFAEGFGKSCPNSVIEGLASGRPAILSESCGIAQLVTEREAGVIAERTGAAISVAVKRLQSQYGDYSRRARELAEDQFSLDKFLESYETLYSELRGRRAQPVSVTLQRRIISAPTSKDSLVCSERAIGSGGLDA